LCYLHSVYLQQNLAIRRKQTIDSAVDDEDESAPGCSTAGGTTTQIQYRDRAKERRKKYGHDKVLSGFETTGHDLLKQRYISSVQEKESEESLKTPISEGNIGSKLLKSMGWSEGQGLGRNNQGMIDRRNWSILMLARFQESWIRSWPNDEYKAPDWVQLDQKSKSVQTRHTRRV
jgi:hypothetical protein